MSFRKALWEHLITRRKYNKLQIKYEIAKEDRRKLETEYEIKKKQFEIKQRIWEQALKEQEEQIIELKKRGVRRVSKPKSKSIKALRKA